MAVSDLLGISDQDYHTRQPHINSCATSVQETADLYLHLLDGRLIVIKLRIKWYIVDGLSILIQATLSIVQPDLNQI